MRTILMLCLFGVILCSSNSAQADNWQVVYQANFSSDPGWTTNSPGSMYWDSASQRYHIQSWDGGNQYAYVSIPYDGISSCKLEYDIEVTNLDWAGDTRFGLGNSSMNVSQPSTWWVNYSKGDGGYGANLTSYSENSISQLGTDYQFPFQLNTMYHNIITYDAPTQTLAWQAVCNGTVVFNEQMSGVGDFVGMDRLYASSIGDDYCPGATGEAYIGNVVFSVPEPATLLLFGLGGLVLKKHKIIFSKSS